MDTEQLKKGREKGMQSPNFGRGRHPTRHTYTVQDIAKVTGRAEGTVRNDICNGVLVVDDLLSVSRYVWIHESGEDND